MTPAAMLRRPTTARGHHRRWASPASTAATRAKTPSTRAKAPKRAMTTARPILGQMNMARPKTMAARPRRAIAHQWGPRELDIDILLLSLDNLQNDPLLIRHDHLSFHAGTPS